MTQACPRVQHCGTDTNTLDGLSFDVSDRLRDADLNGLLHSDKHVVVATRHSPHLPALTPSHLCRSFAYPSTDAYTPKLQVHNKTPRNYGIAFIAPEIIHSLPQLQAEGEAGIASNNLFEPSPKIASE